jgi:hypothetical protein
VSIYNLQRIAKSKSGWQLKYRSESRKPYKDEVFEDKRSFFIVGRHWNSDTPLIPRNSSELPNNMRLFGAIGGGYFLRHKGLGIAIDPGIAFLKLIYERHDITLADIDIVIISHFHQDHCADIENILNLIRDPNRRPLIIAPVPVCQYLDLLSVSQHLRAFPGDIYNIVTEENRGDEFISIELLPALHWQTLNPSSLNNSGFATFVDFHMSAFGLSISLDGAYSNNKNDMEFKKILITGDTFFPYIKNGKFHPANYDLYLSDNKSHINLGQVNPITRSAFESILATYFTNFIYSYKDRFADLICFHIGSIEEQFANYQKYPGLDFQYRGHHLGILGILRLAKLLSIDKLKLGIITEWGEELLGERKNIARFISNYVSSTNKRKVPFFPSDIDLFVELKPGLIKCSDHYYNPHYFKDMNSRENTNEYIEYLSVIKHPDIDSYETTCNWEK